MKKEQEYIKKREKKGKKTPQKNQLIILAESGFIAWSQNIMMSMNSQGTTSFC